MAIASTSIRVAKQKEFADIPLNFIIHPNTKDMPVKKGSDAIKQAVKTLVLTNYGEKPFEPYYGGNLASKMFENVNEFAAFEIETEIKKVLKEYEPRVQCNKVQVDFRPDNNLIRVTIYYTIVGYSEPESVTISFDRIR